MAAPVFLNFKRRFCLKSFVTITSATLVCQLYTLISGHIAYCFQGLFPL